MSPKRIKRATAVWALTLLIFSACALADGIKRVHYVADGDTLITTEGEKIRLIGVDAPEIDDKWGRNGQNARRFGRDAALVAGFARKAKSLAEYYVFRSVIVPTSGTSKDHRASGKIIKDQKHSRPIRIELDPANAVSHHRDRYGRLLAYVYVRVPDGGASTISGREAAGLVDADHPKSKEVMLNSELIKEGFVFVYGRYPFQYSQQFREYGRQARLSKKGLWK